MEREKGADPRPLRLQPQVSDAQKAAAALVKRGAMCPQRRRLRSAHDGLHRHALAVCRGGGETSGLSAAQSGYAPEAKPALAREPIASRPLRIFTRTAPWLCL